MNFYLYTGNKLERLAEKFLALVCESPPPDVFTPETVVVQTQGMAAWLKLRIGDSGRIAANLDTPFLVNFINRTFDAVFPLFRSDFAQFSAELLPWKICRILEREPERYPELADYLSEPQTERKRWQLACRIADLFDQYQIYRPNMLEEWRSGFGFGSNPEWRDVDWQKRLYLELRGGQKGWEHYFSEFLHLWSVPPGSLPERITVFGIGTMPPLFLDFFRKFSEFSDVHFFYLNPCREYWSEQYSDFEAARLIKRDGGTIKQFHDGNPLLASFGAQGREFFRRMVGMPEVLRPAESDLFEPFLETSGDGPDDYKNPTRLTALQEDIYAMFRRGTEPDGEIIGRRLEFPPEDRSVRVHNCHSARREIEVLHDQLLELLEDPEIQPRDIIVMAPDINIYAPYIRSIFGQGALKNVYSVSDRSLRRTSRIAEAFFALLKLRHGRFEASIVQDLFRVPAIRIRFGIEADALAQIGSWIERAGIRWGIDRDDRLETCSVGFEEYSWRRGLDRLLLGFARERVPEDLQSEGLLPLDSVEENNSVLFGRFVFAVERIAAFRRECSRSRTPQKWSEFLLKTLDELFLPSDEEFEEFSALRRAVLLPGRQATAADFDSSVPVDVIEDAVEEALSPVGRNDPFLRGKITFCSLVPMRSIPMKVVAILGLNNGDFPRRDIKFGFNLINRNHASCDRSRQAEDRYLFLEAILSARRNLLFFYQGQAARGSDTYPPAIPLGELIAYLKETAPFEETRHRLQPFEFSYFDRSNPNPDTRSRSCENFEAAKTLLSTLRRGEPPDSEVTPLLEDPPDITSVSPQELERFFANPCRWFLNRCAGIFFADDKTPTEDVEPMQENFNALQQYLLKEEIGTFTLEKIDRDTQYRLLRRSNRLPVGRDGELLFNKLYGIVQKVPQSWWEALQHRVPISIHLKSGTLRIDGSIEVSPDGLSQNLLVYAGLKPKHILRAGLRHLLLTLTKRKPIATRLMTFEHGEPKEHDLEPVFEEEAQSILNAYLALFLEGQKTPLPFFENASFACFKRDLAAAEIAFASSGFKPGDLDDPAVRRCYDPESFEYPFFTKQLERCANILLGSLVMKEVKP